MTKRLSRAAPVRKLLLEFAEVCDETARLARQAADDYSWGEPASWDRTVGDDAKTRATGPSDVVGSVVVGKSAMRSLLKRAISKATTSVNRMSEARDLLEEALDRADHHRTEPRRSTPYPKTVLPSELASLEAARDRREARGEGFGVG